MQLLPSGKIQYDTIEEMTYDLLNDIGLAINNSGYVYDQDNGIQIQFQGRKIKASIIEGHPCYAGQGEVVLDLLNNVRMVTTLLGYAIEKESATNGFDSVSQYIDDVPDTKLTSMNIKMRDGTSLPTEFYNNKCLKYVEARFLVYDDHVDLRNFDTQE